MKIKHITNTSSTKSRAYCYAHTLNLYVFKLKLLQPEVIHKALMPRAVKTRPPQLRK